MHKSGNPVRGELILRKPELTCLSCHAIGGAGGLTGPDLSSLGTSSPAETIIKSIVYPTESIKEGYEMQRVARKDGSEVIGYLIADKPGEITIRRSEEHTSELQSLMRNTYAVFCLKK